MASTGDEPAKVLCYSAWPNGYLDDEAESVAKLYDGFFIPVGTWDEGVLRSIGVGGSPADEDWITSARRNVDSLTRAGASQNFLTVSFSSDGDWPSPATILSDEFSDKMRRHFSAIGALACDAGFCGACVDVEYPYPRYSLEHEVYDYRGYTADDLLGASRRQGHICAAAMLEESPDAVVMALPGQMRCRPIGRVFLLGMLEEMSWRQAPGGFHLGTEFSYCLHDPVTTVAIPRFPDAQMASMLSEEAMDYWRGHCSTCPGVWPLHMVETGGEGYPMRPWREELDELRGQMTLLRSLAKRYVWSFTSTPTWYIYTDELERKYGLPRQNLGRSDIDLRDWHSVLGEEPQVPENLRGLTDRVREFDRGTIGARELCDAFGTPAQWWILGILSNPCNDPRFAAGGVEEEPFDPRATHHGRDGPVRWFRFDNFDPRGITDMRYIFDWRRTDDAAARLFSYVESSSDIECVLHVGWDDELEVRINEDVVFSQVERGKGHGFLYRDRYCFEREARAKLRRGVNTLLVMSGNDYGAWMFSLRLTDQEGVPVKGLRFSLEPL